MENKTENTKNKSAKPNVQQDTKLNKNKNVGGLKSEENKNLDHGSQTQPDQTKEMKSSGDYEEGAADSMNQDMRRSRDEAEDFQDRNKH